MKLMLLLVVVWCLAVHSGRGAPQTAVYKLVKCNPEGDQANCVTHQSPEMAWSPDLPAKLPASTAQHLELVPVEDEGPQREEDEVDQMVEEMSMIGEEGESPVPEEGSGVYEGSASEGPFIADRAFVTAESETGSGESWKVNDMERNQGGDVRGLRRLLRSRSVVGEAKPAEQELRDDHLLQM
ncbi:serglycin [Scophthalmus maximus]|uniref:serglycin n=1 Tax=Scophthalmus maximus TaxID=52904 RepID=UPI0015E0A9AF|nr:serglycin [Scophthalmus maximus]